jgi:hypothetical protein
MEYTNDIQLQVMLLPNMVSTRNIYVNVAFNNDKIFHVHVQ